MTLKKGVEILKAELLSPGSVDKLDLQDAEQLGIEAMKRILKGRATLKYPFTDRLLLGETEG